MGASMFLLEYTCANNKMQENNTYYKLVTDKKQKDKKQIIFKVP